MTTRRWDRSKPPTGPFTLNKDCFQAQGLVCWYPFGGGGNFVPDRVGSNHHTATDVVRTLTDTGAPAGSFNGTTSVLQSAVVPVYAAPLAIGMWVYKTTAADTTTFGLSSFGDYTLGSAGGARRFQFDAYNGDLRWLSVGASTGVASKSGIVSKRWHHMLGTEESTASRYAVLDGVAGAENTTPATPGGAQNRFVLGAYFDNGANLGFLDGRIGEVCVWSKGQYANRVALADPATRFELWYPLRSRKWMVAGGGTDGNASGAPAALTLAAPTAMATGSALASGAPAGVTLTAPTGTASAAGNATATGAPAGLTLTAPTATASGSATASAAPAGSTLTAPTGTASSAGHALATGAPAGVTMTAPTATATGSAQAFAAFMATVLTAPTATASNGDVASVLGSLAGSARRIGPTRSNKQTATRSNRQTATR